MALAELERRKGERSCSGAAAGGAGRAAGRLWIVDAAGVRGAEPRGRSSGRRRADVGATEDYGADYRAWGPDGRELTWEDWALARAIATARWRGAGDRDLEAGMAGVGGAELCGADPGADGAITGGVAVNVDITERRAANLRCRRASCSTGSWRPRCWRRSAPSGASWPRSRRSTTPRRSGSRYWIASCASCGQRAARAVQCVPREAHLGRTMREVIPGIAELEEPTLRRILETGEPLLGQELSGETPAQPGVRRDWFVRYHPLRIGGEVVGLNATVEEITERSGRAGTAVPGGCERRAGFLDRLPDHARGSREAGDPVPGGLLRGGHPAG